MKKSVSKLLAIALCVCMICSMLPFAVAEETVAEVPVDDTAEDVLSPANGEAADDDEAADSATMEDQFAVSASTNEEDEDDPFELDDSVQPTVEPVTVFFKAEPEDAEILVYTWDEYGEKMIYLMEEDGSYLLFPGVYYYDAWAEGFVPTEGIELSVYESQEPVEIPVSLEAVFVQAEEPELPAEWEQTEEPYPEGESIDLSEQAEEIGDPDAVLPDSGTEYAEDTAAETGENAEQPDDEPVKVVFELDPETTELILYTVDENGMKNNIDAEEDGSYLLLPGEYAYDVSAEGYVPVEGIGLLVCASEDPIEITIALPKLQENVEEESPGEVEPEQEPQTVGTEEGDAAEGTAEEAVPQEEAAAAEAPAATEEETMTAELVNVLFVPTPENAAITVYSKDENGEIIMIDAEEDGSYLLFPGEYAYNVSAEGYVALEGISLLVYASEEPIEIAFALPAAEESDDNQTPADSAEEPDKSDSSEETDQPDMIMPGGKENAAVAEEAEMASAPVITKHPSSTTVNAGTKVTFTVAASGEGLSYQWQVRANSDANWSDSSISSAKTTAMTFTPSDSINGYQYRCKVTNSAGTVYSNVAFLTVNSVASEKPAITRQPASATVNVGAKVTLTVAATGGGLSYQWQVRANSDANWSNSSISSAKTTTMVFTPSDSLNGYQYRCAVTNSLGTAYSNTAILTISSTATAKPTITRQPASANVKAGAKISLVVGATGGGLSYQWQVRANSDANWSNSTISSAKTTTMVFTPSDSLNGYQYRCKVTNSYGTTFSNTAILTISSNATAKPTITRQPVSQNVNSGAKVTLTVTATGGGLSYQWQVRKNSSSNWSNSSISSAKTTTMVFTPSDSLNGHQYRCAVTNSMGTTYSNVATLTINSAVTITGHPENISVAAGAKASFSVSATGNSLSYQWQVYDEPTKAWENSSISSAKTATLSFTANTTHNGLKYRCAVTGGGNTVYSNAATLTVVTAPVITKHPEDISVAAGEKASFSVSATGSNLSYQWQVYDEPTRAWENSSIASAKTATLSFTANSGHSGLKYRCAVTNIAGTVYSNEATLTVDNKITLGNLIYEPIDDNTMRVYDYVGENDSSLVVPETVENRTVTEIGDHAFENHSELVSVDLPDTIEVIGKFAFAGCTGLRTMT